MNPTQQLPSQPENSPMFNEPFNTPVNSPIVVPTTAPPQPALGQSSHLWNKVAITMLVIAGIELIVIIGLTVTLTSAPKLQPAKTVSNSSSAQSQDPQPATAVGVQQTNDSISQDIGNLNDDHDLPTNKLDDKSLGL